MKPTIQIEHTIKQDGCTLEGQITKVIFPKGGKRGDGVSYYSKDKRFYITSGYFPELRNDKLYVYGKHKDSDNDTVFHIYDTPKEASQVLAYINEFLIEPTPPTDSLESIVTENGIPFGSIYILDHIENERLLIESIHEKEVKILELRKEIEIMRLKKADEESELLNRHGALFNKRK